MKIKLDKKAIIALVCMAVVVIALIVLSVIPTDGSRDTSDPNKTITETPGGLGSDGQGEGAEFVDKKKPGTDSIDYENSVYTAPITYYSLADIPEGTYCIAHILENGNTIYYQPYQASNNIFEPSSEFSLANPEQFYWVKNDVDEAVIPTMLEGDVLIYKSINAIPEIFTVQRFKDEGYTIGVANLIPHISGNYIFDIEKSYCEPQSDTTGLASLGAEQIFLVAVGNTRVDETTVTASGTVTGLTQNTLYACDIRTGTEKKPANFKADIHFFSGFERYNVCKYYFSTEHTVEIELNEYMPTGYYSVNNCGIFRYVTEADANKGTLIMNDYNVPYLLVDVDGNFVSTLEGNTVDENGFIVAPEKTLVTPELNMETQEPDVLELIDNPLSTGILDNTGDSYIVTGEEIHEPVPSAESEGGEQ